MLLAYAKTLWASGFTLISQLVCGLIIRVIVSVGFIIMFTTVNLFLLTKLKKINTNLTLNMPMCSHYKYTRKAEHMGNV